MKSGPMLRGMVARLVSLVALFALLGCARPAASSSPSSPSPPRKVVAEPERLRTNTDASWRLALIPLPRSGRLQVVVDTPRDVQWKLPSHGILHATERSPRRLSYELEPTPKAPCPFEVTPDRALFCGAAVLPTPRHDVAVEVEIDLRSDESFHPAAASSYGIGRHGRVRARFADLHHAGFVFGQVHHAEFTAEVGRDHAVWVGFFAFDPRWVAAEAAGVRTAVDRWLGIQRPADDPSVGLLFMGTNQPTRTIDIRPLRRGALVQAGPSAFWGARARIDLARLWVQRTVGPALTVDHPEAHGWFDEGFAHGAAVSVLRELGVLTPEEVAEEVSALLAQQAFADEDERLRGVAVRGALLALGLEGAGQQLHRVLRAMAVGRASGANAVVAHDTFGSMLRHVDDHALRSRVDELLDAFAAGEPIPIRGGDVGPCARMSRRRVHRFELGFAVDDGGERVVSVVPGSAAARAGVRLGDQIVSIDHVPGQGDVPVSLVLAGDGRPRELRFLPRGPGRSAPTVTLVAGCEG